MLMNNLDPDVAERPDDLIVYGGSGKASATGRHSTRSSTRRAIEKTDAADSSGNPLPCSAPPRRAARAHCQRDLGRMGDVGSSGT